MSAAKYSRLLTSFLSPDETDAKKAQSIGNETALMFLRTGDSWLVSDSSHRFSCSALLNSADMLKTDDQDDARTAPGPVRSDDTVARDNSRAPDTTDRLPVTETTS